MDAHNEWVKYPTGKIYKGEWCDHCGRYNSRVVVAHALVVKDRKILMVKRGHEPKVGWWALPAGYLDWNESVEEGAVRELKEETGIEGKILKLLGIYSDPKRDEDGRQNVGVTYVVEGMGELRQGEETEAVKWFDLDKLPDKIAFDHRQMIEDYKQQYGR